MCEMIIVQEINIPVVILQNCFDSFARGQLYTTLCSRNYCYCFYCFVCVCRPEEALPADAGVGAAQDGAHLHQGGA